MKEKTKTRQLRSFGLMVGGIFAIIGLWPLLFYGRSLRVWALVPATLLIALGLVLPRSLGLVYRGWMAVGHILGWINTRIILGVIFYVLFAPIGMVMRLLGKDPMHRRFEPDVDSYRVMRPPRSGSHMKRQY